MTTAVIQTCEDVKEREGKATRGILSPGLFISRHPFFSELDSLILGQKPQNY